MLEITDLQAHYGKSHVLRGFTLGIEAGDLVCLIGRNGSGRSTALKAIMGIVPPTGGRVRFRGKDIAGRSPHEIARAGIGYVPEERLVIDNISVDDNLRLGEIARPGRDGKLWTRADMYRLFPRLKERSGTKGGNLSGGEQQMLTICRSLLGNPDLLMIDEPTEGLAPKIVEHLLEVIQEINRGGVAILLVEQKMMIALRAARRCAVMGHGAIVFEGSPEAVQENLELRRRWLEVGSDAAAPAGA